MANIKLIIGGKVDESDAVKLLLSPVSRLSVENLPWRCSYLAGIHEGIEFESAASTFKVLVLQGAGHLDESQVL